MRKLTLMLVSLVLLLLLSIGQTQSVALFEPVDGQAYVGMMIKNWDSSDPLQGDTRSFTVRMQDTVANEMGGKTPSLVMLPDRWQNDDGSGVPFSSVLTGLAPFTALYPNAVPFVSWDARRGWGALPGLDTHVIATGAVDGYITQYARDVRAYGKPVFFRPICAEFNGAWVSYCSPLANANLTKQDYIDAWRRVIDIFRAEHVPNAAFVWSPNSFPPAPANWGFGPDFADYYPGDTYVDWIGIDHYDYGTTPAQNGDDPLLVSNWLDPVYLFAEAHNKPMMISEFGQRHSNNLTPAQEQQWLNAMFDYIDVRPRIKALTYFNYNMAAPYASTAGHTFTMNNQVNYAPNAHDSDHRLIAESGSQMRATFAARMGNPKYLSSVPTSAMPTCVSNPLSFHMNTWPSATSGNRTAGYFSNRAIKFTLTLLTTPWKAEAEDVSGCYQSVLKP